MVAVPVVGGRAPMRILRRVVLPEPLGPRRTRQVPLSTVTDTGARRVAGPTTFDTSVPRTSMARRLATASTAGCGRHLGCPPGRLGWAREHRPLPPLPPRDVRRRHRAG